MRLEKRLRRFQDGMSALQIAQNTSVRARRFWENLMCVPLLSY
jgi:hypothetical protein